MKQSGKNVIGVMGGIFDPVHNGHLAVACLARDYFCLSAILFVPSGSPPHKSRVHTSPADRLAMLTAALRNDPTLKVWDGEIQRRGTSYTIDTVEALLRKFPGKQIYFIVGSDNLREIETWHRYREVLRLVTLCVAHRPGHSVTPPPELSAARIKAFPSPQWGISSTYIRSLLAQGHSCRYLVPDQVLKYIAKRKLYSIYSGMFRSE